MTQEHTPGPWEPWAEGGAVGRVVCEVERLFGKGITIRGPELPMLSTEQHEEESWANAHLIAAAPELLAVLEKLCGQTQFVIPAAEWDEQALFLEAQAAVAKATGEAA